MDRRGPGRGVDRRSAERSAVDIVAEAAFDDGTTAPCRIRDLSAGGARLEIDCELGRPDAFDRVDRFLLLIARQDRPRPVRVAWRYMTELGVAFLEPE